MTFLVSAIFSFVSSLNLFISLEAAIQAPASNPNVVTISPDGVANLVITVIKLPTPEVIFPTAEIVGVATATKPVNFKIVF